MDGVFLSFSEFVQKYDFESKGNSWKYLKIRDSITNNFWNGFVQHTGQLCFTKPIPGYKKIDVKI